MSEPSIKSTWPWMPTIQLKATPKHTHPALEALAQMEAQQGLSREVIWRYGELFEVIMGDLLGHVQPLGFWRGHMVAAVVEDGLDDELLKQCAQRLWHVQTGSPRVCDALGADVPSFHVNSMACVHALAPHHPRSLVVSIKASLAVEWPINITSSLTVAPIDHDRALTIETVDELLQGQWRAISIAFDIPEPNAAQQRAIQLHANCQTFSWLHGQLGQRALVAPAPALWSAPGRPRHFIPMMCLQDHLAQMWMMWDRAIKRPRAMRCDGYALEALGRPGPFGVLPASETHQGPWSPLQHDGYGWACAFMRGGAQLGSAFVGSGRRFGLARWIQQWDQDAYQALWDQHPDRGGAVWLEAEPGQLEQGEFASIVFHEDAATIEWCGFQRVYRFRGGELTCLTTDHSFLNLVSNVPANANLQAMKNIVLVYVGMDLKQSMDIMDMVGGPIEYQRVVYVQPDDRFLLANEPFEQAFGRRQITQWMREETPFEVVEQMRQAMLYTHNHFVRSVMVVDSDASVISAAPSSGPMAYNFAGSSEQDVAQLVLDAPMVLNAAMLFFNPTHFDGCMVEFAGILNFPDVHTRVVADAWWNAPHDQVLPEHGVYVVRARGLWCADGGRYGEGGAYASEFRGHLEIVEPIAHVHVPPNEARWYRYMMFSSEGVVEQTPERWSWQGLPMFQGGPLGTQIKWPTVDKTQRRRARIVAASGHSMLLVFSIEWLGPPEV